MSYKFHNTDNMIMNIRLLNSVYCGFPGGLFASIGILLIAAGCLITSHSTFAEEPVVLDEPAVLTKIGDETISINALERATQKLIKTRYFHPARVPQEKIPELLREAAQQLVDRKLLAHEARRRGMKAVQGPVEKAMQEIDRSFSSNLETEEEWELNRNHLLQMFRSELEEQDLQQQLQTAVNDAVQVSANEIEDYYTFQPDKFTTPPQVRASMILLGVDPGASMPEWDEANKQAKELLEQLKKGAEFSQLAREHSSHASAELGGNLGTLHKGILALDAEVAIEQLAIGEFSEVLATLEGSMILRVDERIPAKLNAFESVKERATGLALRKAKEIAWEQLIADLREATPVSLNEAMLGGQQSVAK